MVAGCLYLEIEGLVVVGQPRRKLDENWRIEQLDETRTIFFWIVFSPQRRYENLFSKMMKK